jgi:hypothetical protein
MLMLRRGDRPSMLYDQIEPWRLTAFRYRCFQAQLRLAQNGQLSEDCFQIGQFFNYDEPGSGSLRAAIIIALDRERR